MSPHAPRPSSSSDPALPAALVLAGTAQARAVLGLLAPEAQAGRLRLIASLAGATARPRPLPAETRSGGFGGAEGLAAWLAEQRIGAVLDATHPFAANISANACAACARLGLPRAVLTRPPWPGGAARFPDIGAALAALPKGARALAATGRGSAPALAVAAAQADRGLRLWLRVAEPGPVAGLPESVRVIVARPPHDEATERALLSANAITHLVARDSGGTDGAKLTVAATMGVQVLLVARPPAPEGETFDTPAAAAGWLRARLLAG
ncbi:MAG: precorrin-6A/cobalt-precorrin-6A reductase [Pseudomonadota bacterium]|nr:precorrin-6A/cobalt-precorrin-6A reductase [Pseudomonadota bacterium]